MSVPLALGPDGIVWRPLVVCYSYVTNRDSN